MIVISDVVTVTVHRPDQVFFQPMGVTVRRDHFGVVLQSLENRGDMRCVRSDSPDDQRKT
jgi:glutamine amidotransferase PdxT